MVKIVNKNKVKSIMKDSFTYALFIFILFMAFVFIVPTLDLTKTIITKKPTALAATCLKCTINASYVSSCSSGSCSGTCDGHSPSHCLWNCGSSVPGCGDVFCGSAISRDYLNRPVNNRCESVNGASATSWGETATTWTWQCKSGTGHTIGCSTGKIINGVCGAAVNSCSAGTPIDTADGACTYNWTCAGINGGTQSTCSKPKPPVNGVSGICLGYNNGCSPGSPYDTPDGLCTYNWTCLGTAGSCGGASGASPTCTLPKPPINGVCGTASKTYPASSTSFGADTKCASGTPNPTSPVFPAPGASTSWVCDGSCGGTSPTCTATRQSMPTYYYCNSNTTCASTTSYYDAASCQSGLGKPCYTNSSTCTANATAECGCSVGTFTSSALIGNPGATNIKFSATPGNNLASWVSLNYGDGQTQTLSGSSAFTNLYGHTYNSTGNYTVTLTGRNSAGNTCIKTVTINIIAPCTVSLNSDYSPDNQYSPLTVNFAVGSNTNANPSSYLIHYNKISEINDPTSTLGSLTGSYTYTSASSTSFQAYLEAKHLSSETLSCVSEPITINITVKKCNINSFTATPPGGFEPLIVTLNANSSYVEGGATITTNNYNLDYEKDGIIDDSTEDTPPLVMPKNKTYNAINNLTTPYTTSLESFDNDGVPCINSPQEVAISVDPRPILKWNISPVEGDTPLSVKVDFTNTNLVTPGKDIVICFEENSDGSGCVPGSEKTIHVTGSAVAPSYFTYKILDFDKEYKVYVTTTDSDVLVEPDRNTITVKAKKPTGSPGGVETVP